MIKKQSRKRLFLVKIISVCVILACIFALASCDSSSNTHKCLFGGQSLNASNVTELNNLFSNLSPGVYYYYMTKNINVTSPIQVPEGVFIGICRVGGVYNLTASEGVELYQVFDRDAADSEGYGKIGAGGIYLYSCGTHGSHAGHTYYKAEQSMFDLFADSGKSIYSKFAVGNAVNIALTSDVVIDDEVFVIPEGYTLRICLNTPDNTDDPEQIHDLTIADGLDLTKNGGELVIINCMSSTYHECIHLNNNKVFPIDSKDVNSMNQMLTKLNSLESGDTFYGYLVDDLAWQGELEVKEGVTVMICLNGFSADGALKTGKVTETVTDTETGAVTEVVNTYGSALFFDCSNHLCQDECDTGEMLALSKNSKDWTYSSLRQMLPEPTSSLVPLYCVLEEDIELDVLEGFDLRVCLNGFKHRESVSKTKTVDGVETVVGSITYYNCASSASVEYHSCSLINLLSNGTMQSNPIDVESVADLNKLFGGLSAGEPYVMCLTKDVLDSGTVYVPENVMAIICLNGHNMDGVTFEYASGAFVFVYQCANQYCEEVGKEIPALDQNMFDFIKMLAGDSALISIDEDMYLAVTEDVNIAPSLVDTRDGAVFHLCTCGHTITGLEGVEGTAQHSTCTAAAPDSTPDIEPVPSYTPPHSSICFIPSFIEFQPTSLKDMTLDEVNSLLGAIKPEQVFGFYYLESDLVGAGTINVPEGIIVGICQNGYEISDLITLGEGVYVYECKEQYCSHIDGNIHALNQDIFDFVTAIYTSNSQAGSDTPIFTLDADMRIALSEDIVLSDNMFAMNNGAKLYICTCGYDIVCNSALVANGDIVIHSDCNVGVLDCAVCDRNSAKPLNFDTLTDMIDDDGRIILPKGSYYYYLENDFQLTRAITVPAGVDIHICLHGYKLSSAYIWCDSKTFGYGYPESPCTNIATVEEGGVWNIYDCSEYMTGSLSLRFFRKDENHDGIREILITVSDDNQGFEGLGEGLGAALSTFVSNIAVNAGTINIYGGNFYSMIGFMNQGKGVINFYRGNINSAWMGVLQGNVLNGSEVDTPTVYIGSGATISSGMAGVYGIGGDVVLDGGTINAGFMGIAIAESDGDAESSIVLNGGTINVADTANAANSVMNAWTSAGGTSEDLSVGDLFGSIDSIYAVSANSNITINGDVTINTGNLIDLTGASYSDMQFAQDTNVTVSENVKNNYTLAVDGKTTVGENDVFNPTDDCMKIVNSEGEIVIMPVPSSGTYASVYGISASTDGEVTMNLYVKAIATIKDRILLYVQYDENSDPVVYEFSEADIANVDGIDMYRFSLETAAKDYKDEISFYFVLLPAAEGVSDSYSDFVNAKMGMNTVSLERYLDALIDSKDGEKIQDLAQSMKNYCAAAAKHFNVADSYEVPAELEDDMNAVDAESLKDYAPGKECAEDSKATFKTVTLMLKSKTSVRIYFDLAEGYTLDDIDVSVSYDAMEYMMSSLDVSVVETGYKSRPYYVEISGMQAKDLDKIFTVSIDKLTIKYSVMSYVYSIVKNADSYSEDLVYLAKSLAVYHKKATDFFECEHEYDNACDGECNYCEYKRTVPSHNYETVTTVIEEATSCNGGSYEDVVRCKECGYISSRSTTYLAAVHVPGEPVLTVSSDCGAYYITCSTYCTACSTPDNNVQVSSNTIPVWYGIHTWSEPDANGNITCTKCSNVCSADGHTAITVNKSDSGCDYYGITEYSYCSVCNELLTIPEIILPTGHTAGEPTVQNNVVPTCATEGAYDTVVSCTACSIELSREHTVVPALAHTPGEAKVENTASATCTSDGGYDSVVYCTVCNGEISREHKVTDSATGHTHGEAQIENAHDVTCTTDGYYETVVYCSDCGFELSRTRTVNDLSTGHIAAEPVTENQVDPTCDTEGGYDTVVYCSVCDIELSREHTSIPTVEHTAGEAVKENVVEATCDADGSYDEVVYCSVCNTELSRENYAVISNGHVASDSVIENANAATCTSNGSYDEVVYCSECSVELSRDTVTIPATEHNYQDGACTECGASEDGEGGAE